jgi:PAS domain S-box-containing protein/diguanylate cyclase (GGDEF)-like protein
MPNFHIAIIDDEPDLHAALKLSLKNRKVLDRSLTIHSAYSRAEGLELINNNPQISLIFLDVVMETDDAGFEFLRQLRDMPLSIQPQVVMLTGQPGNLTATEATERYDINAYLAKPELTNARLISTLATALRNYTAFEKLHTVTQELEDSQFKIQETDTYLRNVLNSLSDALITINSDGNITSTNPAVAKLFGFNPGELIGQEIEVLMPEPYASRHKEYMANYKASGQGSIIGKGRTLPAKKKDGSTFPMEITITEFENRGETMYLGVVRNISDKQKAQEKIYKLAYTDTVTDLPNLTKFYAELKEETARQYHVEGYVSLLLLDISGFYRINQAYGHDVGDQLLILLADRIQWVLPDGATLFRSEGTDFLVEYKSAHLGLAEIEQTLRDLSEQIFKVISQDIYLSLAIHQLSSSIGILTRLAKDIDLSKVLHQLEFATHQAKKLGRNQYYLYDRELEQHYTKQYMLEQDLSKAIERNELSLWLQPQINSDNKIACSEALLRWHSKKFGFVSPAEFIPILEESGLIVSVGRWVIETACQYLSQCYERNLEVEIAINISAKEILQPDFIDFVVDTVLASNIPPASLTLELTESTLATDIEHVIANMNALSKFGVRFSIDDFGTGYSSLRYLQKLPLHELKIDKSFVDDIVDAHSKVAIVDTIITMAQSLNLVIVAEGVETEHQVAYLRKHDRMLLQGYYFSRPLPFTDWLEKIELEPSQVRQVS